MLAVAPIKLNPIEQKSSNVNKELNMISSERESREYKMGKQHSSLHLKND